MIEHWAALAQELLGLTELDAFLTERLFALTRGAADCATFEDCLLSIARCRVRLRPAYREPAVVSC